MRAGFNENFRQELQQINIKLGTLLGERGRGIDPNGEAITKRDLSSIPLNQMKSVQISAAPTMDDYNALQADVSDIHITLSTILGKSQ